MFIVLVLLAIVVADECPANGYCKYDDIVKASNAFATDLYKVIVNFIKSALYIMSVCIQVS